MSCGGGHLEFSIGIKKQKLSVFRIQVVSEKKRFETFFP
jgi:hypothetical protein